LTPQELERRLSGGDFFLKEALRAARLLLKGGELRGATSRAYYAMFRAARALLN